MEWNSLDQRAVDTIRALAMDSVEKVGNGHPGTAMSLAPTAYTLWHKVMRHDPADPHWPARDRFVLSCGHSSLTLYIQLFFAGYGLELEDLQRFRTWGSLTPGHPEYGHTVGVETTTGPLGQGVGNAVGMAMAARYEQGLFEPDAPEDAGLFEHTIWVIASDGDLQEGINHEVAALAGHLELGNLVLLYDDNSISIDGDTNTAMSEDVLARYAAYGWHTLRVEDGEDVQALHAAMQAAKAERKRPSIISIKTVIAWPAPHAQGTAKSHGSALGAAEIAATKTAMGMDPEQHFDVATEVLEHVRAVRERGAALSQQWHEQFALWRENYPERASEFDRIGARELPEGWHKAVPVFPTGKDMATRKASGEVLNALSAVIPELWGGSADLAESNNTSIAGAQSFESPRSTLPNSSPYGRILHWGIREHAMGSTMNGIALHGGARVYGGTFLVFSDYMRPAVRLAAMMKLPVTYVWTHDSIGLGEDGPTHQPVEHLSALRAIPGLAVVRPADANETAIAWKTILENADRPHAMILSRQNLPTVDRTSYTSADLVARGAYILSEESNAAGRPDAILLATGSEVTLALETQQLLKGQGYAVRVVSVPCVEWFDEQDQGYRDEVLPPEITARVSIEAGIAQCWHRLVGSAGHCVSLEHFGASADYKKLFAEFGFTAPAVAHVTQNLIETQHRKA